MVFGIQTKTQLQNDVFCLKEERDYFQTKFLEQVSEIANLKDQLRNAKKEIDKLRHELMQQSMSNQLQATHLEDEEENVANGVVETMDDASSLTSVSTSDDLDDNNNNTKSPSALASPRSTREAEGQAANEEDEGDDDDDDSVKGIRQSAEKLLQWANYRSSVNTMRTMSSTPEHSSVASPSDSALANSVPGLLDQVPKTISQNMASEDDDEEDEGLLDGCSPEENRSRAALLLSQFDSVAARS